MLVKERGEEGQAAEEGCGENEWGGQEKIAAQADGKRERVGSHLTGSFCALFSSVRFSSARFSSARSFWGASRRWRASPTR